jgi:type II secretory pathway pseudopilin PulG
MKFLNKKQYKGFTLLETLTSIAILAFVIIGPLSVIMNSSSYARKTRDTMVATYLAEEAIELLQHRHDSIRIFCKKNSSDPLCAPISSLETPGQIAWRIFKSQMQVDVVAGQPSCYVKHEDGSTDNAIGCAYDLVDMVGDVTVTPSRRLSNADSCLYIVPVKTQIDSTNYRTTYMCGGIPAHITGTIEKKYFARSVSIEWLPTFETDPSMLNHYDDDLRIKVTVQYKGLNGYTNTASVIRFMHAQP